MNAKNVRPTERCIYVLTRGELGESYGGCHFSVACVLSTRTLCRLRGGIRSLGIIFTTDNSDGGPRYGEMTRTCKTNTTQHCCTYDMIPQACVKMQREGKGTLLLGRDTAHRCPQWQLCWCRCCSRCVAGGKDPGRRWSKTHHTSTHTYIQSLLHTAFVRWNSDTVCYTYVKLNCMTDLHIYA